MSENKENFLKLVSDEKTDTLERIKERIANRESLTPPTPVWVPVEERLPESFVTVPVLFLDRDKPLARNYASHHITHWEAYLIGRLPKSIRITHWLDFQ